MTQFGPGDHVCADGTAAVVETVGADGRLHGHVPGVLTPTWWHPCGHHLSYPALDLRPVGLAGFDHEAARQEGWLLSARRCAGGVRRIQIRRDGSAGFSDDHEAWHHVVVEARRGSAFHRDALSRIDHRERMAIESWLRALGTPTAD